MMKAQVAGLVDKVLGLRLFANEQESSITTSGR